MSAFEDFMVNKTVKDTQQMADLMAERDTLLARVKELDGEVELAKAVMDASKVAVEKLKSQLHQRDTALVECRNALEALRYSAGLILFERARGDHALSQIQAVKP